MSSDDIIRTSPNKLKYTEVTPQMEFFKEMLIELRKRDGEFPVWPRRIHYFIVSRPKKMRQIPTIQGNRLYENNHKEYKNTAEMCGYARLLGLIPMDWIIDLRNFEIMDRFLPQELDHEFNCDLSSNGVMPSMTTGLMDNFEKFMDNINLYNTFTEPQYQHQDYRIVVVIEKNTYRDEIKELCNKHGADFLIFKGQPSVTRTYEICMKAKESGKPMAVIYCHDLDVAGWMMPYAFMKRVHHIYPNTNHVMERALLTREQAKELKLPTAFTTSKKHYPANLVKKFSKETHSKDCVELDALTKSDLLKLIEEQLVKYSGIEDDKKELEDAKQKYDDILDNFDSDSIVEQYRDQYNSIRDRFNRWISIIRMFKDRVRDEIYAVDQERLDLEDEIKTELLGALKDKEDY